MVMRKKQKRRVASGGAAVDNGRWKGRREAVRGQGMTVALVLPRGPCNPSEGETTKVMEAKSRERNRSSLLSSSPPTAFLLPSPSPSPRVAIPEALRRRGAPVISFALSRLVRRALVPKLPEPKEDVGPTALLLLTLIRHVRRGTLIGFSPRAARHERLIALQLQLPKWLLGCFYFRGEWKRKFNVET